MPESQPPAQHATLSPAPPVAKRIPTQHAYPHAVSLDTDYYHWMKDTSKDRLANKPLVSMLEAENAYAKEVHLTPNSPLTEAVYTEFLARIEETDQDVPHFRDPFWYYTRTVEGLQYPIHCRKRQSMDADEEAYLDANLLTQFEYIDIGSSVVSPSHALLAYSLDTEGDEIYTIKFKNLETGEALENVIENTDGSIVWNKDNTVIFYSVLDALHRPTKLYRHVVGTTQAEDVLIYENVDEQFWMSIGKSGSGRFLIVSLNSSLTSEVHFLDLENESSTLICFSPREFRHRYEIEHQGDHFYILTDGGGQFLNKKLQRVGIESTERQLWQDVLPYNPFKELSDMTAFEKFIVVEERAEGLLRLRILDPNAPEDSYLLPFEDAIFHAETCSSRVQNYTDDKFRFLYTNQLTPTKTMEYNVSTKSSLLLKQKPIPGGFDPSPYTLKRIQVPIPAETQVKAPFDTPVATEIPVTLLYRTDLLNPDGKNKLYLYGYGSYGVCLDPAFSSNIFSYVDRGIVVAYAHIRGGGELGRGWYETGKFLHKKNTFTDFVACAEHLVSQKFTRHELMAIEGASAGGLLMGAVLNLKPDIAHCAIAGVPFVDVINTMMDPSIPLTVNEYEEWGNPNEKEYFDYMLSYSPYDNVREGVLYPNLFVKAGLNDPRVQYWEPAKWVAKLRALGTQGSNGERVMIMDCKMGSGHFGASGRYGYLKEKAGEYAFVIWQLEEAMKKVDSQ
ncbi:hypothetical protein HDU80_010066 [Chytriomyces hyalinus]|nr:hypothetical protein HDU80_010066 [Chytriomyces hyalinus]